ncbi:protein kinase domain-containing protein [Polyangium spumosum]|uniref:protein kinase domain-containing protein n=1 Tax=Polyangium spumosum TaxID=889282 RepID=UPI001479121A
MLAGRYRVERTLGRGAMGIVLSATHLALGGFVAVKVLSPRAAHRRGIARLQREARATARIRSEHVARVMDVGMLGEGRPFIVMEYLEGADVAATLKERGPLPITEVADMIVEACDALAAAHVLDIIHRDLKPSNLFLARQLDGSTRLKVLDFGLSKIPEEDADGRLTSATAIMGSPHYMAPEQIANPREVDARADIWSLGVVLYELLTGERPFDGLSQAEIFARISTLEPARPSALRHDLSPPVESLILGCLQKDPAFRPVDVGAVAASLAPFCSPVARLLPDRIRRVIQGRATSGAPGEVEPEPTREGATMDEPAEGGVERTDAFSWGATASRESGDVQHAGMVLGGRFHVERLIGRGAMGAVYEVSDDMGERFAVKLIPHDAAVDPEAGRRLRREAQLASALCHVHVVTVVDVCIDDRGERPFIVMELLRGRNLAELLQAEGAMPPRIVARIFRQVCRGLAAAHERGLIHRDVKPANIFLHEDDTGAVTVKLCDFGIAKRTESNALDASAQSLTKTGFMLGTPAYVSPEQVKDPTEVDSRSDIWSLCVSMYEALSGKHPWPHCRTPGELIIAICTKPPIPLMEAAPWIDPALARIVLRGLDQDPTRRWQSAVDLDRALDEFACGGAPLARDELVGIPSEERRPDQRAPSEAGSSAKTGPWRRVPWRPLVLMSIVTGAIAVLSSRPEKPSIARAQMLELVPELLIHPPEPAEPAPLAPPSSASPLPSAPTPPAPRGAVRRPMSTSAPVSSNMPSPPPDPTPTPPTPPAPSQSTWVSPSGLKMQKGF